MATDESDYDVWVVVDDDAPPGLLDVAGYRSANLDLAVWTLAQFRGYALPGEAEFWDAYSFVGARVLLDRCVGLIGELAAHKARLGRPEAHRCVAECLDPYTNSVYRSLKSRRDGRTLAARLDAVESVPFLVSVLFALHGRIRPYNKYLQWELEHRPLGGEQWSAGILLPQLELICADGDPGAQRAVFAGIEQVARREGHGDVLDAWGDDLSFIRGHH